MQLAAVAADPARLEASRSFNDLAFQMTEIDGTMTSNARNGNKVAAHWPGTFQGVATQLASLRDAFVAALPSRGDLASSLQVDTLNVSFLAGRLDTMVRQGMTYASYWGEVMDAPIANARAAADALIAG